MTFYPVVRDYSIITKDDITNLIFLDIFELFVDICKNKLY